MATRENQKANKVRKRRFYKRKGFWLGLILFTLICGVAGWFGFDIYTRPFRERAETYDLSKINDLEIPSVIYDRNGKEIGRIFVQNRSVIKIDDVPDIFIEALKAGEDQRFMVHKGVDYIGIARAVWLNFRAGETTQGASTITQQLARNAFDLEAEKKKRGESGMQRKIVEAFLARRIEQHFHDKRQILEFYLNRIYFGSGYYGIRSASLGYFGKEPKDLTALESAAIVGCIKNPTGLSPLNNPEGNRKSRNLVLGRMAEAKAITNDESSKLSTTTLKLNPKPLQRGTSHLYERIADEIRASLGPEALSAGGFRIHTSIDGTVQVEMEKSLRLSLEQAEATPGYANQKRSQYKKSSGQPAEYLQGAGLMIDHQSGEVLAYVGGRDYGDVPFDMIEMGRRPLGTAFLPFVYAAGLQQGLTPATMVDDEEMDLRFVGVGGREGVMGEWGQEVAHPGYDRKPITARRALESSKVAASVRFAQMAGLQNVVNTAENFGLPMKGAELLPRLGTGWESASMKEAVRAISAFARAGQTAPEAFTFVDRVENAEGSIVYERKLEVPKTKHPIDDATAFMVHSMLRGGMEHGSASGLTELLTEKPFSGAGKTGTTHDFSDNWFLGYNGRVSCGVWVGFLQPNKTIYEGAFSRDLAMPVWANAMNAAAKNFGGKVIPQPDSVQEVKLCSVSGQRATPYCYETVIEPATGRPRTRSSEISEFFRKNSATLPFCPIHSGADPAAQSGSGPYIPPQTINTTPVRAKEPVLLGDDPYLTEQLLLQDSDRQPTRTSNNVLDSFDLGDSEKALRLPWPKRVKILPE